MSETQPSKRSRSRRVSPWPQAMELTRLQKAAWAVAGILVVVVALASLWFGGRAAWGDAKSLSARWTVAEWREGRGPAFTPALWIETRDALRDTLKTTPDNAQLYDDLGFLHASRAQALGGTEPGTPLQAFQHKLYDDAIALYRQATVLRPTFPFSWAYLALAKDLRGQQDAEMWFAFDKAVRHGHTEAGVRDALGLIAFRQWKTLTPERQQAMRNIVAETKIEARERLLDIARSHALLASELVQQVAP